MLVEYDPRHRVGLLRHIGTAQYLEKLLGVPRVDLVIRESVIDELKEIIYGEALDVFGTNPVEVSTLRYEDGTTGRSARAWSGAQVDGAP